MRKILYLILFLLIIPITCLAQNQSQVKIITLNPDVGKEIKIKVEGNNKELKYLWKVDDKKVSELSEYVPTAADYESWIEVEVTDSNMTPIGSDKIYFSKLPVVYINTNVEQDIIDRDKYVDGKMLIQGNREYELQYDGEIEIKGRGTSTWHYEKKPYKIKLGKKTDLFGFGKSKHYVLLANYLDPSLMRNEIGYKLGEKLGLISTESTWVDVVFNGKYIGNYQLCEHIRIGKQLINITDYEDIAEECSENISENTNLDINLSEKLEENMTENLEWLITDEVKLYDTTYKVSEYCEYTYNKNGGYLFELDTEEDKEISNFKTKDGLIVNVSKPEYTKTNNEMMNYIKTMFQDFENAVGSIDGYNDKGEHYTDIVDVDSMVGYWLTMEIMANEDASVRSRFLYKEIDEKLKFGPVWDFDISSGAYRTFLGAKTFNATGNIYAEYWKQDIMREFTDDPYFQMKVQEKYWEIRPYLEELIKDNGILDHYRDYLYESAVANETLWTSSKLMKRSFTGEKGDFEIFKSFLKVRINWMDKVFDTQESTTKNMKFRLSKNAYNKTKKIDIEITNAKKNNENHEADYLINENQDINIKIKLKKLKSAKIYINGKFYKAYNKKTIINENIENKFLTEKNNKKNVITIIASKGKQTYINYITISKKYTVEQDIIEENYEICEPDTENLIYISKREASNDKYGIEECYYSNKCQTYYKDKIGSKQISPKEVIISLKTSNNWWGRRQYALLSIHLLLVFLSLIVLAIIKIKKKK